MIFTLVINDAPYGNEKAYNALRLAMQLQKDYTDVEIRIFLMADAAFCAIADTETPNGYYNIERMIKSILAKGGKIKACGTCGVARGVFNAPLIEGVERSNMAEYTAWVYESDKVINF
ncbi:DsrE/F sulfur relay family protein YchN [Candidatus Kapaibacterium sp.]